MTWPFCALEIHPGYTIEENKNGDMTHTHNKINTVIFGQISLEKPNAGKLVQQMRVLLI